MQKTFSLDKANESLIFVDPILEDIRRIWKELSILKENLSTKEDAENVKRHFVRLEYHLKELLSVGCVIKDLESGRIDFPCIHDGTLIHLCYESSEEEVAHWHPINSGFEERKAIDEEFIFIEALKRNINPSSSLAS